MGPGCCFTLTETARRAKTAAGQVIPMADKSVILSLDMTKVSYLVLLIFLIFNRFAIDVAESGTLNGHY